MVAALSAVLSHDLRLADGMPLDSSLQIFSGCPWLEVDLPIQGIKLEEVSVRFSRRRTWSSVTDLPESVFSLPGAVRKFVDFAHIGGEVADIGRQVEQHPVRKDTARRIGIVCNQGQATRARGRIGPGELR